jgi:hypothetical protein
MNIQTSISKRLSLTEIHQRYPNQWVLIIDPRLDDELNLIEGEVIYATSDKDDLYHHLYLSDQHDSALEYTGNDSEVALLI